MPGWRTPQVPGSRIVGRIRDVPLPVLLVTALAVLIVVPNELIDVIRPGSDRLTEVLSEWLLMPTIALAAVALWLAVRRTGGDERLCWIFIFLGMVAELAAELPWGLKLIFAGQAPDLSISDVFWLLSYVLWFAGLYVLDRSRRVRADAHEGVIDALIITVAAAIMMWELVVHQLVNQDLSTFELIVNFMYVGLDLGVLWLVLRPVFRFQVRWTATRSLLAAGMLAFAFADLIFILPLNIEYSLIGSWAYVATGGAGIAAVMSRRSPDPKSVSTRKPRLVEVMPFVMAAAVSGLLIYRQANGHDSVTLVAGVLTVLALLCVRLARTIKENRRLLKAAENRAVTDELTGLRNHRFFHELLEAEITRARRHGEHLGLMLIDVDRLKTVNDSAGHRSGDALLRAVASTLKQQCRQSDTACRIGGDEMAVVAPNVTPAGLEYLGERIVAAVQGVKVDRADGNPGRFGASVSVGACVYPDAAPTKDTLIERADCALYHAKRAGRERMVLYSPSEVGVLAPEREFDWARQRIGLGDEIYRSVIDTMMEGVVLLDSEGVVRASNAAAGEILGVSAGDLYGTSALDPQWHAIREDGALLRNEDFPPVATARTGEAQTDQVIGLRLDGTELKWLLVNSQPVIEGIEGNGHSAVLATFIDITKRKRAEARLEQVAYHDELTGLANVNLFSERLELACGARRSKPLAVLWIGLDDFGLVNESLGSKGGDQLLKAIGARLEATLPADVLVARHSGDEFMVLFEGLTPDRHEQAARSWATRIHVALREPCSIDGDEVSVGASIGVSLLPGDAGDAATLMENADRAMHRSKRKGRSGTDVFHGRDGESAETLALTTKLRKAVDRGHFVLYYQPIVDLESAWKAFEAGDDALAPHIVGAESLIRWQDPQSGLVLPGEFIPVAERAGLIESIGDWVMDRMFSQQREWQERGFDLTLGFNLSPPELRRPDLAERVLEKAAAAGADPSKLMIEITESAVIANLAVAKRAIAKLRRHGVSFAIDDFGTGFSTLGRLKEIPTRTVKVDAGFLQGVPQDPNASAMLAGILQIAAGVGRRALAEGIETKPQWEFVVGHGCKYGQGYYFSRPLPASQLTTMLEGKLAGIDGR